MEVTEQTSNSCISPVRKCSFVRCGALTGKSAHCSDAGDCGLAPAYGLICFFLFVLNCTRLGADFLDVAFFMNSLSVLVSLATFKRHRLVADRAFRAFDVRLTEDAIEGRHRTKLVYRCRSTIRSDTRSRKCKSMPKIRHLFRNKTQASDPSSGINVRIY